MRVLEIAKEAIKSDVVAVIGYNFSDHALLAGPLHQKANLPLITPTATADRISELGDYVHQMAFSNSFQARVLAQLAQSEFKATQVASVVAQDCAYCRDLNDDFVREFEKRPGMKVVSFPVLKGDTEFDALVKSFKTDNRKFNVIFIPNHEVTSAKIVLAFLKAGMRLPFLGGDGWANYGSRIFSSMFADWSFKAIAIGHWRPEIENSVSKKFLADYLAKYQSSPNMTAAMAYDSMLYMIRGLLSCSAYTRIAIEKCLQAESSMDGTTGHYVFGKGKAPEKGFVLQEFKNNKFEFVRMVIP